MDFSSTDLQHEALLALIITATTCLLLLLRLVYIRLIRPRIALRNIPGPLRASLIWGHAAVVRKSDPGMIHESWREAYGNVFQYEGILGVSVSYLNPVRIAFLTEGAYARRSRASASLIREP